MTEKTGTPDAWVETWTAVQRKYMDAWLAMASQITRTESGQPSPSKAASEPVAQALEFWTQMMAPALPAQARALGDKLAELGQGYLQIGENLWRMVQGVQTAASAGSDWQSALQEQLQKLQQGFTTSAGGAEPSAGMATLWGMPLQHWRRLSSSFSVLPGDVEQTLRGAGSLGPEALQRELRNALSVPAVGYMREWQTLIQEWGRYSLEHTQAMRAYETTLTKVGTRAFELLTARLQAMGKGGEMVDSVRAAYDLWVDCAEEAYADVASGDEFPRIQARLTNTLMVLKRHEQQMAEELQAALNVPTRGELNTTHARVQGLRRELRELRHQVEELGLDQLPAQMEALRGELQALQTLARGSSPPESQQKPTPVTRRKAAPAKTAPRKAASRKGATARKKRKE